MSTTKRISALSAVAALIITGLTTFAAAGAASATEATDVASAGQSVVSAEYAPDCLRVVEEGNAGLSVDDCKITTRTTTSDSFVVTEADIRADKSLSATQRLELLGAISAQAITGKHYSQFTTGAAYTRTHNGTFYYNGSRVWVTQAYSGYTGSHSCFTNYAVGLTIQGTGCSDSGGTTWRTLRDTWTVGWGTAGAYSVTMACTVYTNGTIAGPGTTVG